MCIPVSVSLYEALWQLRALVRQGNTDIRWQSESEVRLWIDQICINQHDSREKTAQVKLMREIYHNNERTIVWLGPYNEAEDGPGFDILRIVDRTQFSQRRKVHITLGENSNPPANDPDIIHDAIDEEENERLGLLPFASDAWASLARLLHKPWFNRAWIIQEAVMSKSHHLLLCGTRTFEWNDFADAIDWLDRRSYDGVTAFHFYPLMPFFIYKARHFFDRQLQEPCRWTLEGILAMVRSVGATNPRDHIFALLGLVSDVTDLEWPQVLEPDYDRNMVTLFCDVARYCINKSGSLTILRAGGVPSALPCSESFTYRQCEIVPTWTPRWDLEPDPNFKSALPCWYRPYLDVATKTVRVRDSIFYDASFGKQADIQNVPGCPHVLRAACLWCDRVSFCSELLKRDEFTSWDTTPIRPLWELTLRTLLQIRIQTGTIGPRS